MIKCSVVSVLSLMKSVPRDLESETLLYTKTFFRFSVVSLLGWESSLFPQNEVFSVANPVRVNLVEGDAPINWWKFSRSLSFNMDNSEAFRSSTWSMSTEQNFPCELCIFSRKQGGFLDCIVSDSVGRYILSSTTSPGCPTENWLHDSLCF